MSKPRRLLAIFIGATAFLCCLIFVLATIGEADTRSHFDRHIAGVDASNGIDEREAEAIAWAYFLGYVSGCGGPDKVTRVGGQWIVPASLGYAGKPMKAPIRIDAATGAVSQLGGPSFGSYRSFRLILMWGLPIRRFKDFLEEYYRDNWASPEQWREYSRLDSSRV